MKWEILEFYSNLNGIFFRDLELDEPEVYLDAVGDDLGATMGNIIDKSYKLMVECRPDAVLVLGDTNSCLSVIGAKRLHIPIFHMEAGNRCKDECLPEETNRRIVDIISDVNMAYSEHARRYLADCGLPKERTFVTGSPMAEVLHDNLDKIKASDVHARLSKETGVNIEPHKYILLSAHREENIDTEENFTSLFTAINKMAEKYDMPILYSCHPRSRKRIEASEFELDKRVRVEFYSNLNGVFFKDLKLADPDIFMEAVGDDLGATMGNIIDKSYKVMVETKPDAVLVLGDTNSCLSVIGAKRLHIPIFHMEAGNRCKDECLPEETNRRIVDIISDVNMAYSEHARRYLADCGLPKERTYVTGSPMAEVLHQNLAEIEASDIHAKLGLEKGKYILLSAHREENIDTEKNFMSLFTAINKMAEKYDMPILYSCHPRSRKRLEASGFQLDKRVIQHEPLGFHDYNCLQMNAFAVVSDSGTLPEESSFFTSVGHPFPAICIRTSTERPEALDKACFFIAGIDEKSLLQAVDTAVTMNQNGDYGIPVPDYIEENVSTKVVKIIQSYTGIVNRMVWRKS